MYDAIIVGARCGRDVSDQRRPDLHCGRVERPGFRSKRPAGGRLPEDHGKHPSHDRVSRQRQAGRASDGHAGTARLLPPGVG